MANIKDLEIISKEGMSGKFVKLFMLSEKHYSKPFQGYHVPKEFLGEDVYGPFSDSALAELNLNDMKSEKKKKGYVEGVGNSLRFDGRPIEFVEYEVTNIEIPKRYIVKDKGALFIESLDKNLVQNRRRIFCE